MALAISSARFLGGAVVSRDCRGVRRWRRFRRCGLEGLFVGFGGVVEAGDFADELEGGGADVFGWTGGSKLKRGFMLRHMLLGKRSRFGGVAGSAGWGWVGAILEMVTERSRCGKSRPPRGRAGLNPCVLRYRLGGWVELGGDGAAEAPGRLRFRGGAAMQKAMCSSSGMFSSSAPLRTSSRFYAAGEGFIFRRFFTESGSRSRMLLDGRT